MKTVGYESEHDTSLESDLFPAGPDRSSSVNNSDTDVQGVKTENRCVAELPTPQQNVEGIVESVTEKHEGVMFEDVTVGVAHRTVPPENIESVTSESVTEKHEGVTEGVESVTDAKVIQQDLNAETDIRSHDTSSDGGSEDSMFHSDDEMDAYFSDNSNILWILATGTVLFTPPLDESDATVDYELEADNIRPSADLYEIYERSQKLV